MYMNVSMNIFYEYIFSYYYYLQIYATCNVLFIISIILFDLLSFSLLFLQIYFYSFYYYFYKYAFS
jgi:hypothetical protein